MRMFIAIDPGNKKCGLLLADIDKGLVLDGRVVAHFAVIESIKHWESEGHLDGILLGNGTSSKSWYKKLKGLAPIQIVQERGTTLRARSRYWELWPPGIFLRLLPRGLILPSQCLDAVAALVLLEDHLNQKLHWPGPPSFKILPEQ